MNDIESGTLFCAWTRRFWYAGSLGNVGTVYADFLGKNTINGSRDFGKQDVS